MAEIRWRHSGQRLVLPVTVLPSVAAANSTAMEIVEALIDTGATGTGLRPDVADRLQIPGRGRRRVQTANGDILVPEFRIRLGFFPGVFESEADRPAAGMPHALEHGLLVYSLREFFTYPLLVGMDVLSQCDLELRRDRSARLVLP
jgi:hypothetical protein